MQHSGTEDKRHAEKGEKHAERRDARHSESVDEQHIEKGGERRSERKDELHFEKEDERHSETGASDTFDATLAHHTHCLSCKKKSSFYAHRYQQIFGVSHTTHIHE